VDADTVRRYYDEADALAFLWLRDSGGSALLEAMTRGLPVICLDWGGPAKMLGEYSGIRLPANTSPMRKSFSTDSMPCSSVPIRSTKSARKSPAAHPLRVQERQYHS
jgi:glycosyltransferase involved in cell wall biosynthesis